MAAVEQLHEERRSTELEYQQVCRLHLVMSEIIQICGRPGSNFPTLAISMHELAKTVRSRLVVGGVTVKDVRLNGGAASYILQSTGENPEYNDLDLIYQVDLSQTGNRSDRVKEAVLGSLQEVLSRDDDIPQPVGASFIEDAYVRKMVKVSNETDCWSLMSLTNANGHHVELKFVDRMKRQFEFSVDSFQIVLNNLFMFYSSEQPCLTNCHYPRILAESVYGPFHVALSHLNNKVIATRSPEQIRGGGLLKYCYLLARGYRHNESMDFHSMKKYMCSRFFIDFPETIQQQRKLENYLEDHFVRDGKRKSKFLTTLYNVVQESTVCLMGQERKQTLDLISSLAQHAVIKAKGIYANFHQSSSPWYEGTYSKHFFQNAGGNISAIISPVKYSFPSVLVSPSTVPLMYYLPHVAYS